MIKELTISVALAGITSLQAKEIKEKELSDKLNQESINFTENKGQVHDQNYMPCLNVLYGVMAGNLATHITSNCESSQLYGVDKPNEVGCKLNETVNKPFVYFVY